MRVNESTDIAGHALVLFSPRPGIEKCLYIGNDRYYDNDCDFRKP